MKHYVYILYSDSNDRYYIGSSADTEYQKEVKNSLPFDIKVQLEPFE